MCTCFCICFCFLFCFFVLFAFVLFLFCLYNVRMPQYLSSAVLGQVVNARSRSRVRTDGRTVRYERQSRRVDGRFDAWLGVSWRAASLRTGLDLERLYDRPSGYATWTARSLTFYVMSYACAHGRCHTAPPYAMAPPGVHARVRTRPRPATSTPRPPHVMFLKA